MHVELERPLTGETKYHLHGLVSVCLSRDDVCTSVYTDPETVFQGNSIEL